MRIESAAATDVGRVRDHNEDAYLVDQELGLFVVCDGMGGHASGEVASALTIRVLQNYLRERVAELTRVDRGEAGAELLGQLLTEAISSASSEVNTMGTTDRSKRGMGTTCSALLIRGAKGAMGHVGDSRLYVTRNGLHQLSDDHTFSQEAARNGLDLSLATKYQNVLTRAVGTQRAVKVDTLGFDVLPGDTYLLCSDGLHKYAPDAKDLSPFLENAVTAEIPQKLVAFANEAGGSDNVTALVVRASRTTVRTARAVQVEADLYALRHIELFAELNMAELVRVYGAFRERRCAPGEEVIHEDEESSTLFVIVSGTMEVQKGHTTLAVLSAGAHFGEMALLNMRRRTATVRAMDECHVLTLDREAFVTLIREDAVLGVRLLWRLAATLSVRLDDVLIVHGSDSDTIRPPASDEAVPVIPAAAPTGFDGHTTQVFGTVPSPYRRGN